MKNASIKEVLTAIEQVSDIRFFYNDGFTGLDQKVNVSLNNHTLEQILSPMLKSANMTYYQMDKKFVVIAPKVMGEEFEKSVAKQGIPISGTVTDETGYPMPGVNITVKGTLIGVVTSSDGNYSIIVPDKDAVLVFSFVGYITHEMVAGEHNSINISLIEDTRELEEVVVIGYGSQSRRNVTGSVAKVNMDQLENLPNSNVTQALRGRIAGVQFIDNGRPGQNGTILVRGQRSITAKNDPLIIVDGVFFNGSLADINPTDVSSMEVLKDASAAAIYGSRAANGVILITTKKGTTVKPTIKVNTYYGVSDWSHKIKLLSPERYIQRRLDYRTQVGLESDPAKITDYLANSESANYQQGKTINGWDVIAQNASVQSYNLSISGMTDKTNYFISGSMIKEKGLIVNDKSDRVSMRINVDNKVTDWLSVGVTSQFSIRDMSGVKPIMTEAYYLSPFANIYYDDDPSRPTTAPTSDSNVGTKNPLFASMTNKDEEISQNIFANIYALVKIPYIDGLTYRLNYSPNYRWHHHYKSVPEFQNEDTAQRASAQKNNSLDFDWVIENILNYDHYIGKKHRIHATVMYGRSHSEYESTTAIASNFFNGALGWNNLSLASVQQTESTSNSKDEISSMARINYTFMDRYLLTLTARRDGCSVFGENNKFATFPSVSLAWIASDENFVKRITAIDMLKFRLSYGSVGNQAINPYSSLSRSSNTQYVFGDGGSTYVGIYPSSMANSSLKWETTKSMNVAVDFQVLNRRIGGTIEYYNMNTENLLLNRAIPTMTGFSNVTSNIGATNNKGIEITLNTVNIKREKFSWETDITFSTNKNKIVHLYRSDINGDGIEDDDVGNKWFIGQPISVNYDYELDGVYQIDDENIPSGFSPGMFRIKDQTGEGDITPEDRKVLSQKDPKFRWGITNTLRYEGFTLSVFVNALRGWKSDFRFLGMMGDYQPNFPERAMNGIDAGWWTVENRSNTRPALTYLNPRGHGFYDNKDFIRIQDVSLSYDFSEKWISKWRIADLRAYVSAKNLYTFTDYVGFDPESGEGMGYPMPRSVVFGVNISF